MSFFRRLRRNKTGYGGIAIAVVLCVSTVAKGEVMIDRKRSGRRCRTTQFVRTVEGELRRDARGTIRYETENLGRSLVMVQWDQGFIVPVFPHEIEVFAEEAAPL